MMIARSEDEVSESNGSVVIDFIKSDNNNMGSNTTNTRMSQSKLEKPKELSLQIPTEIENDNSPPPPTPLLLVPCLKGKMSYEGGTVICKGLWAMSESAHSQPGQCSEFEFKLIKADEDSPGTFPINGKYQGWFQMKQPPPHKGSVKVEDKEIYLSFTASSGTVSPEHDSENSIIISHSIQGKGLNKFGSFNLHGTLDEEGNIQIYREYFNLTPSVSSKKKNVASTPSAAGTPSTARKSSVGRPPLSTYSSEKAPEDQPRSRKPSQQVSFDETPVAKSSYASKQASKQPVASVAQTPTSSGAGNGGSFSDRAHRMSGTMRRCLDLLKELSKHPQAIWFLEPVDPIKLGIPEYTQIVTNPMDFKTIRTYIESGKIETAESFAELMRLVFKNAVTFNQLKENPVHIAALEMSGRFEDRFRILQSQTGAEFHSKSMDDQASLPGRSSLGSISGKKPKFTNSKLSIATGSSAKYLKTLPVPRQSVAASFMPPSIDPGALHILEMQREMELMKEELKSLRAQVREHEITQRVNETKEAAHNPLTFEEKKILIGQVHKLPSHKMEQVLEIIQAAMPSEHNGENDEEIEVPLDSLDTFTLRKLQKFIEENGDKSDKKKRGPSIEEPAKRAKKPKKDGNGGKGSKTSVNTAFAVRPAQVEAIDKSPSNHYSIDDNLLNDESADLLFTHEDEDFSDFEMDISHKENTHQMEQHPGKSHTNSVDNKIIEAENELEELLGVDNAETQSIEIEDSSAWASTIKKTTTNESALGESSVDSGLTEKEDSSSSIWKHSAEEIRAKRAASSQQTELF
mmetsp:Transcript_19959/g.27509  ORF Transcript_19959/g.27509 Transcript_19959/m.27509 type:complete len:801 (-) Transcript_19959:290-2692(-)